MFSEKRAYWIWEAFYSQTTADPRKNSPIVFCILVLKNNHCMVGRCSGDVWEVVSSLETNDAPGSLKLSLIIYAPGWPSWELKRLRSPVVSQFMMLELLYFSKFSYYNIVVIIERMLWFGWEWTSQSQLFEYSVLRCWFRRCGLTGGALSLGVDFEVQSHATFSYSPISAFHLQCKTRPQLLL